MAIKRKLTSLKVDQKFFDNIFEKERMKLERRMGVKFTQRAFTEFCEKRKVKFKFPKMDVKNGGFKK